jgi:hypothetical protein
MPPERQKPQRFSKFIQCFFMINLGSSFATIFSMKRDITAKIPVHY